MKENNEKYFKLKTDGEIKYLSVLPLESKGIKAYFSTRQGGISTEPYQSLNLGFHTGDDQQRVIKNRKKLGQKLNFDHKKIVCGQQVHGNRVYQVKEKDMGRGSREQNSVIPEVDALITDRQNITLFSFFADCVPLYFFAPREKAIGLAHAGWRGTVLKISLNVLYHMNLAFGTNPESVQIVIGPSICGSCYEVDAKVMRYFHNAFSDCSYFVKSCSSNKYLLSLSRCNQYYLQKAGIKETQIFSSQLCTKERDDLFYSYRREKGETGRMAAIFSL